MFKSKIFGISLVLILIFTFLVNINTILAQSDDDLLDDVSTIGTDSGGCPQGAVNCGAVDITPALDETDPNKLISKVINAILGVIGSLALLMFVFGGFTWMTSSGSPEKVKKGRDIIVWAVIGLAIIFFSYALVNLVIFDVIGG